MGSRADEFALEHHGDPVGEIDPVAVDEVHGERIRVERHRVRVVLVGE
ncbi:MAG: hypothetical protein ACLFS9_02215 [Nitriliruptoraceae bacterium]